MPKVRAASRPRFRLLPTVLLTVAILGLPSVVYAWGRSSSSFEVKRVVVGGTDLAPAKQVRALLRDDYLGRNLFTVTAADVTKSLAPLCFVKRATVDRDFPDTLRVGIEEYVPTAYGLGSGGWYVVTSDGYVVCEVTRQKKATAAKDVTSDEAPDELAALVAGPPEADLEIPRVLLSGRPRAGQVLEDEGLHAALRVVEALPSGLRGRLAAVQRDDGALTLRFAGGPVAVWGDAERTQAKIAALKAVLARYDSSGKSCTFMDVSMPERVLAKPVLE